MTAPTPERRVGEGRCRLDMVQALADWPDSDVVALPVLGHRARDLARDLLDERAAVARLTAEVERLRKFAEEVVERGIVDCYGERSRAKMQDMQDEWRKRLAALSLPTPAPEATE